MVELDGNRAADAVTDWHAMAVQVLAPITPLRPGQVRFLDLAAVQAAVHDAVQAIDRRFQPYHSTIPDAIGSPAATAASAAHDVLVNILPDQAASLGTTYHEYLATHGLVDNPGVRVGQAAALASPHPPAWRHTTAG
jgi:hypothetical protein